MTSPSLQFEPLRRSSGRLRRVAAGGVALVVVGAGVAVASRGSSSPAGYRTAVVATRDVDQVLDAVATVEPVSQATVAFPVAGTVDQVRVAVGDTVAVGQSLAALDLADLHDTLDSKQAALDQAALKLAKALAGEDVGGVSNGNGSNPSGSNPSASSSSTTPSSSSSATRSLPSSLSGGTDPSTGSNAAPSAAELRRAAQAVADAQHQVDVDLATAAASLAAAQPVCAAVGSEPPPTTTTSTTVPSTTTTVPATTSTSTVDSTTTTTPETGPLDDPVTACTSALAKAQADQQAVAVSEHRVGDASATYADLLARSASSTGSMSPTGSNGSNTGGASTGTNSPSTGSTSANTASAADLVAFQKSVDAATSAVAVAEQAIDAATIVSPIAGTVVSVPVKAGDAVTASSSTARIVVVGRGGYEVTTKVSVTDLPHVKVGQAATVVPDGGSAAIAGEVVSIGVAPTTSGSTTAYPVVISLTGDTSRLGNGSTASVSIVTDQASGVLAVPTSAVTTEGTRHTVTLVDGSTTTVVAVGTGAVGREWTEITSGLRAGQQVGLADLSQPLPGSATSSSNGSSGSNRDQGPGGFGPPQGFRVSGPGG